MHSFQETFIKKQNNKNIQNKGVLIDGDYILFIKLLSLF